MSNIAILSQDSPFYSIFPGGRVPILTILQPMVANCLGDGIQDVYMVALDKLTPEQFEAIAKLVNERDPSVPFEQCKAEILERGLPLRKKMVVSVSSNLPYFL